MIRKGLLAILGIVVLYVGYELVTYPNVASLRDQNPETTSFMEIRAHQARAEGKEPKRDQTWVPIDRISPNLVRAVLAGEDARFFQHDGFDYEAIELAARKNWEEGEFKRGASTITQQLAKNLYLSESKNPIRKAREAFLTMSLERNLSKWRILEIYLNVIEWGDGVYGAEAAARTYFGTPAAKLSPNQAAYLSAMIPNPRTVYNPKVNPKRVKSRQRIIERGMRAIKLPAREAGKKTK